MNQKRLQLRALQHIKHVASIDALAQDFTIYPDGWYQHVGTAPNMLIIDPQAGLTAQEIRQRAQLQQAEAEVVAAIYQRVEEMAYRSIQQALFVPA